MVLQLMRALRAFPVRVQLAVVVDDCQPGDEVLPGSGRRFSGDGASVTRLSRGRRSPARSPGWRRTHPQEGVVLPLAGGTTLPGAR